MAKLVLVLQGCFSPPGTSLARLDEIKREGQALNQAADELEARLLASQSNVSLWTELAIRHQHVSAIAIRSHDAHLNAMVQLMDLQAEKARALKPRPYVRPEPQSGLGGPVEDGPIGE